jgi:hypothetical protein
VPLALLGQKVRVRWDAHLVRVFQGDTIVAVHARVADGVFAPPAGEAEASTRQQAYVDRLVGQCERVGPALKQWADAALAVRGVRAIRLIQGVLNLTRTHPRERVLAAVGEAHAHHHFRSASRGTFRPGLGRSRRTFWPDLAPHRAEHQRIRGVATRRTRGTFWPHLNGASGRSH